MRLVTFLDYRCPYCRVLSEFLLDAKSLSKSEVIFKEWPILGEASTIAARAALAARKQGRYTDFHQRLMGAGFLPTMGYVTAIANELQLDEARFLDDLDSPETTEALRRAARCSVRSRSAGS